MIINHSDYTKGFNQRNQLKDLAGYLFSFLSEGTNCSPLEAQAIAEEVKNQVTLFIPDTILPGKLVYYAVEMHEPAGKAIKNCKKVNIYLTLIDPAKDNMQEEVRVLRQKRLLRITEEAFNQGALLTEEDCASILNAGIRTVRRDVDELRKTGNEVLLRGYIRDIGRTISHKVQIIQKYIEGTEIVDLITKTKHTLESIERYLNTFGRVVYLDQKGLPKEEISFITKTSLSLTEEYIKIYKEMGTDEFKQNRIRELTGERYKKKLIVPGKER